MALRTQPYLPLYVQDFLTDEKLAECSASSVGVYIRLMCLMHKSDPYGKILLKQKYKQCVKQISDDLLYFATCFALQISKNLLFSETVVCSGLHELLQEGVINVEGDYLCQKRMVKDGKISDSRAKAGGKGGKNTQSKIKDNTPFASNFAKANIKANTENEYEYENENNTTSIVDLNKDENQENSPGENLSAPGSMPGQDQIIVYKLPEMKVNMVRELVAIVKKKYLEVPEIHQLFEAFKIQHFTGTKYYADENAIHSHFINWTKTQNYDNANSATTGSSNGANNGIGRGKAAGFTGKSGGFVRLADSLRDELTIPNAVGATGFGDEI